jgi:DNA-binding transcriptional MocR family regulator
MAAASRMVISIATVYQAYIELEKRGLIEVRPKSGYYVKPMLEQILPAPALKKHRAVPQKVSIGSLAHTIVEAMSDPSILQLGGKVDSLDIFNEARKKKISILPGTICSTTRIYDGFIRISCGFPWHDTIEKGIQTLGEIIHRLRGRPGRQKNETMRQKIWNEDQAI